MYLQVRNVPPRSMPASAPTTLCARKTLAVEGFGLSSYLVDMVLQAEVSVKQVLAAEVLGMEIFAKQVLVSKVFVLTSLVWLVFLMYRCNLINVFPVKDC